ncbi:MAG: hypothetical protein HY253_10340 [Burkholderiales bacterium]|nr:hypothetical protein [Burkholderiales bacterium]
MIDTHITPRRIDFLRLLTRTGFASTRHLAESGLIKNATTYSQSAFYKPMLDQLLIGRMMILSPYGIGKRVMYYLTKKGAQFVADADGLNLDNLRYFALKGGIVNAASTGAEEGLIRADFPHKEAYVSTLIAFERYLENTEYQIAEYQHYYDRKVGSTSIEIDGRRFRPDGLIVVDPLVPSLPRYAFIVELHRHSDRKKILQQLKRHVDAFKQKGFADKFGQGKPHFVLSIYAAENVAAMKQVIDTLKQDPEIWPYVERFFMFAELDALRNNFYEACIYFGGSKKPLPLTNRKDYP